MSQVQSIPGTESSKPFRRGLNLKQQEYPAPLYESENLQHDYAIREYADELYDSLTRLSETRRPRMELYEQQPALTNDIRIKLINFAVRMSVRLKLLPFVLYRAIKIFDRYCCERVVALDLAQLLVSTCLWISSKIQGGNNHYVNLDNIEQVPSFRTITDLGYGAGGRFNGPTERFRPPKLHELVRLCGSRCNYSKSQFKQMELHILTTLNWELAEPSIEECIITSADFNVANKGEIFSIKTFLSYMSLFSYELVPVNIFDMGQVTLDLINEVLGLDETDHYFQRLNPIFGRHRRAMDLHYYAYIKEHLLYAVLTHSQNVIKILNLRGAHRLYQLAVYLYGLKVADAKSPSTPGSATYEAKQYTTNIAKNAPLNVMPFNALLYTDPTCYTPSPNGIFSSPSTNASTIFSTSSSASTSASSPFPAYFCTSNNARDSY